jgi:hypothetical protein
MLNLVLAMVIGPLGPADPAKAKLCDKDIQDRLSKKITFEQTGGPLSDVAGYLCARADVPLAFDEQALGPDVRSALVRLNAGKDVRVATAFQQVLDQLDATYVIRDGKAIVVPKPKQKKP